VRPNRVDHTRGVVPPSKHGEVAGEQYDIGGAEVMGDCVRGLRFSMDVGKRDDFHRIDSLGYPSRPPS
jgi:hypothetical protein